MRPIKLRAYDKNKSFNKMSYAKIEHFDDMLGFRFEHFESEPEDLVFMQYTGCEDRKGQGIYEGDIIKEYTTEDEYFLTEVIYTKGCFMGKEPGYDPEYPIYDFSGGEVIGNIYENPELLGGKYV